MIKQTPVNTETPDFKLRAINAMYQVLCSKEATAETRETVVQLIHDLHAWFSQRDITLNGKAGVWTIWE